MVRLATISFTSAIMVPKRDAAQRKRNMQYTYSRGQGADWTKFKKTKSSKSRSWE